MFVESLAATDATTFKRNLLAKHQPNLVWKIKGIVETWYVALAIVLSVGAYMYFYNTESLRTIVLYSILYIAFIYIVFGNFARGPAAWQVSMIKPVLGEQTFKEMIIRVEELRQSSHPSPLALVVWFEATDSQGVKIKEPVLLWSCEESSQN